MPALTDKEILAALPAESRHKIDNAFEALSQSLPSDKERNILYRVAFTLKLNPTDTHFSVMAALHYYLQLYQMIPEKIVKAGEALEDITKKHQQALNSAGAKSLSGSPIAIRVSRPAQHQSSVDALKTSIVAALAFSSGMFFGAKDMSSLLQGSMGLALGTIVGAVLCFVIIARAEQPAAIDDVHEILARIENRVGVASVGATRLWTEEEFQSAAGKTNVSERTQAACRGVLVEGLTNVDVLSRNKMLGPSLVSGLKEIREQAK